MTFCALLTRIVGNKRVEEETNSTSRSNGTTFTEFFSRFPGLHEFLLSLVHSYETIENDLINRESGIYALLVLFSKLVPSPLDSPTNNPNSFIPFVTRCASHSNYMVCTDQQRISHALHRCDRWQH